MLKIYLLPLEVIPIGPGQEMRGPKYFAWKKYPYTNEPDDLNIDRGLQQYGFTPYCILVAPTITQSDHDWLISHADVFAFPDNLDGPVDDPNIDTFFEAIHLPTDWLTPSTTYRELLRQTAGIMQFNQRYAGIYATMAGGWHSIFDSADLDTRLNQMTAQEQSIFLMTVASFDYDPDLVPMNAKLRQLVRHTAGYWASRPILCGGIEI